MRSPLVPTYNDQTFISGLWISVVVECVAPFQWQLCLSLSMTTTCFCRVLRGMACSRIIKHLPSAQLLSSPLHKIYNLSWPNNSITRKRTKTMNGARNFQSSALRFSARGCCGLSLLYEPRHLWATLSIARWNSVLVSVTKSASVLCYQRTPTRYQMTSDGQLTLPKPKNPN